MKIPYAGVFDVEKSSGNKLSSSQFYVALN